MPAFKPPSTTARETHLRTVFTPYPSCFGNHKLNHALHMAAICQLRQPHCDGRAYFERRVAEGKTNKEAIRALKRQTSNTVYRHLVTDAASTHG